MSIKLQNALLAAQSMLRHEEQGQVSSQNLKRSCSRHWQLQCAASVGHVWYRVQSRQKGLEGRASRGSNEAIGSRHAW